MKFNSLPVLASTAVLALASLSGQAFAQAYDGPYLELPFPCDQTWQGAKQQDQSIDFTLRTTRTDLPVVASTSGTFASIRNDGTYYRPSYTVVLNHQNGYRTEYGNLRSIASGNRVGSSIAFGRRIGTAGKVSPNLAYLTYAVQQYDAQLPIYIKNQPTPDGVSYYTSTNCFALPN